MSSVSHTPSPAASGMAEETVPCPQLEPGALYRLRRQWPESVSLPESTRALLDAHLGGLDAFARSVGAPELQWHRGVFRTYEEMVGMPDVDVEGEACKLTTDDVFMFVEAKRCVELNCCCYHVLTKNGPGWFYVFCEDHDYLLFEKVTA